MSQAVTTPTTGTVSTPTTTTRRPRTSILSSLYPPSKVFVRRRGERLVLGDVKNLALTSSLQVTWSIPFCPPEVYKLVTPILSSITDFSSLLLTTGGQGRLLQAYAPTLAKDTEVSRQESEVTFDVPPFLNI